MHRWCLLWFIVLGNQNCLPRDNVTDGYDLITFGTSAHLLFSVTLSGAKKEQKRLQLVNQFRDLWKVEILWWKKFHSNLAYQLIWYILRPRRYHLYHQYGWGLIHPKMLHILKSSRKKIPRASASFAPKGKLTWQRKTNDLKIYVLLKNGDFSSLPY